MMAPRPRDDVYIINTWLTHGTQRIRCRTYVPQRRPPLLSLLFAHGGGCVSLSPDAYDGLCSHLSALVPCRVIAPAYRLAPEHPFPAAIDDVLAVYQLLEGANHGLPLVVCGDSAGGYLVATLCLELKTRNVPQPQMQVLIYPNTDLSGALLEDVGADSLLTADDVRWAAACYLQTSADRGWRTAPLRHPDPSGVAECFVISAEADPLLNEGRAYVRRLRDADVPVTHVTYEGMPHGFVSMAGVLAPARHAIMSIVAALAIKTGASDVAAA